LQEHFAGGSFVLYVNDFAVILKQSISFWAVSSMIRALLISGSVYREPARVSVFPAMLAQYRLPRHFFWKA
jgi:hypothetical protein